MLYPEVFSAPFQTTASVADCKRKVSQNQGSNQMKIYARSSNDKLRNPGNSYVGNIYSRPDYTLARLLPV